MESLPLDDQDIYTLVLAAIIIIPILIRWSKPDQRFTKPLWTRNGHPTDAATMRALGLLVICALVSDAGGPVAGPLMKIFTPQLYVTLDQAPWAGIVSAAGLSLYVITVTYYTLMIYLATTDDHEEVRTRLWPQAKRVCTVIVIALFGSVLIGQPQQYDLVVSWDNGLQGTIGQILFWTFFGAAYFLAGIATWGRIRRRRKELSPGRVLIALTFMLITALMMITQPWIRFLEILDTQNLIDAPWAKDLIDINIALLCIGGFTGAVMIAMGRSRDSRALKRLWTLLSPVDPGKHLPTDHKTGSHPDQDRAAEIQEWLRILVWRMPTGAYTIAYQTLDQLPEPERTAAAIRAWIHVALNQPTQVEPTAHITGLPDLGKPHQALHTLIRVAKTPHNTYSPALQPLETLCSDSQQSPKTHSTT